MSDGTYETSDYDTYKYDLPYESENDRGVMDCGRGWSERGRYLECKDICDDIIGVNLPADTKPWGADPRKLKPNSRAETIPYEEYVIRGDGWRGLK